MLPVLLLVAFCSRINVATECAPERYLCSGACPLLPEGIDPPTSEAVCFKDPHQDTCVCWLHNPSSQLRSLFQCEAQVNGSVSKITCIPPSHCFLPDSKPVCLIILDCRCVLFEPRFQKPHPWKRVKAIIHTKKKHDPKNNGHSVEKIQGDVREFSLQHLLFLLGFVIAPLLCWCLLNFFHEGKCRKKPPQPPEAQPIPTARNSTVDNMNNDDGESPSNENLPVPRPHSVESHSFPIQLPSAPEDLEAVLQAEAQQQAALKCESPPPYCESEDRNYQVDYGPPPTYEDAVREADVNIQQLWQPILIIGPNVPENV